jgi:CyaY protein
MPLRPTSRARRLHSVISTSANSTAVSVSQSAAPIPAPLSDSEYHALSAALLSRIEATADRWLQDDVIDVDTQRTGGLLELSFPRGGQLVVNTQPPLHEIWLAARGGGFHFRWAGDGRWLDTRSGDEFFQVLSRCASEEAGAALTF